MISDNLFLYFLYLLFNNILNGSFLDNLCNLSRFLMEFNMPGCIHGLLIFFGLRWFSVVDYFNKFCNVVVNIFILEFALLLSVMTSTHFLCLIRSFSLL